jgi:asparagine synthetase A
MPELQAEAVVDMVRKSRDYDLSKLATKDQILLLDQKIESIGNDLEQKIELSRAESRADIEKLNQKIDFTSGELNKKIDYTSGILNQKIENFRLSIIIWILGGTFAINNIPHFMNFILKIVGK